MLLHCNILPILSWSATFVGTLITANDNNKLMQYSIFQLREIYETTSFVAIFIAQATCTNN